MRLDAFKTNGSSPPECGPDFQLTRQSTIYLLAPLTDAARVWAKEHIPAVMTPKSADPNRYKLHVVSFSVVREAAPEDQPRPTLNDPNAVAHLARQIIADDAKEHFWALLLDSQHGFVAAHEVSTGTLSASLVHPREVFGPALRVLGVASVVLIHNHPSGDPTPSREDLRLTRQLVEAGKLLDIRVHDHVIMGNGSDTHVSLAQRGDV